jgi:RimJ/RimL family protein N-acetyltransferase
LTRIVYGDKVGYFVCCHNQGSFAGEASVSIGLERCGQIVAGCTFENYNGASMVAHLAIKGRITGEFLWCLAYYAFRQHSVNKLIAPVESINDQMMRLAPKLGFAEETRIRGAAPSGDIVIWTMTAKQCRFLEGRYCGKTKTPSRA